MVTVDEQVGRQIRVIEHVATGAKHVIVIGIPPLESIGADGTYRVRVPHVIAGLIVLLGKDNLVGRLRGFNHVVCRVKALAASARLYKLVRSEERRVGKE